jgi:SpoVK/Ycf46/Vps4 family AAA+-type ATPase
MQNPKFAAKRPIGSNNQEEQIVLRSFFNGIASTSCLEQTGPSKQDQDRQEGGPLEQASAKNQSRSSDISLLTEFLIQMDSFSVHDGFLVIGTTNFLSDLDSAFIRSGRFDRIIGLTYPGKQTRIALLQLYAQKQGYEDSIDWPSFAKFTKGFSAADLAKVVNESSLFLIQNSFFQNSSTRLEQLGETNVTRRQEKTKKKIFLSFKNWSKPPVHTSESLKKGIQKISSRQKFF